MSKLPGVGRRTALRLAIHILRMERESVAEMTESIDRFRNDVKYCAECNNLSDEEVCPICLDDERDRTTICVVEQVADVLSIENTHQYKGLYHVLGGVISPMIFMAIGGAPLGFAYKAVNTLDSMVGYRNDKYRYFGTASARADDVLNFIPARLAGLLMVFAACFCRYDASGAWRCFLRDRNKHLSPNSAQTESACAGALGILLGGVHDYFGKPVEKPMLGDEKREAEPEDIRRAVRLMIAASLFSLILVEIGFAFLLRREGM